MHVRLTFDYRTRKQLPASCPPKTRLSLYFGPIPGREPGIAIATGHHVTRMIGLSLLCAALLTVLLPVAALAGPSLDAGYRSMYGFQFPSAEREFQQWRLDHPDDPLGPVSQAANLLFSELARLGILQAQFFVDDSSFTSLSRPAPDRALRARFDAALDEGATLARARLARAPRDADALFAMALVNGLQADYTALVEGRNVASLSYTREGARWAKKLLAAAPWYADAYLATGISDYIIGSIPAPVRWVLRVAGYAGDKKKGIEQLQVAASRGRLLAPLARILLGIAYLREGDRARARDMLAALNRDFPSNPLFAREIRRLDAGGN